MKIFACDGQGRVTPAGATGVAVALAFLLMTDRLAVAGEVLGVLDPHTGILAPTAPSVVASAAAPDAATPPVTRLGAFKLVFDLTFGPEIPTTAGIFNTVRISTSDPKFANLVTSMGQVSRSGSKGTLTLYLPYYWTVASAGETVSVYFDAAAGAANGYYDTSRFITVPLPKNGALTTLNLEAAF